jgi:hypothetical protein
MMLCGSCAGQQRLSYCADCDVIKGRAQARGFSVAQVQDAFENNSVAALFGHLHSYMIGGTRFDPSSSQWTAPPASTTPHPPTYGGDTSYAVAMGALASNGGHGQAAVKKRKSPEALKWNGLVVPRVSDKATPGSKKKRKVLDVRDMLSVGEEDGGPAGAFHGLLRCALCR